MWLRVKRNLKNDNAELDDAHRGDEGDVLDVNVEHDDEFAEVDVDVGLNE